MLLAIMLAIVQSCNDVIEPGCVEVDGSRIRGRDLATRFPEYASRADIAVGLAPAPGVTRWLRNPEVCVVRRAERLSRERVLAAVARAVGEPAEIELLSWTGLALPAGEIALRASGGQFRGHVENDGQRFPVWAKARVAVERTRLVAILDTKAGTMLDAGNTRVESRTVPWPAPPDDSATGGRMLRKAVGAGQLISPSITNAALEVARGETVNVIVRSGEARIHIAAAARGSGRRGERVVLENPSSGNRFYATVTGPRQAEVAK